MLRALKFLAAASALAVALASPSVLAQQDDLAPIADGHWNYETAAHLLERAGFGGTPAQIEALAALSPREAVNSLVHYDSSKNTHLLPFEHSGIHDPGLEPFPPSRPATTELAKQTGEALGVKVKPQGLSLIHISEPTRPY